MEFKAIYKKILNIWFLKGKSVIELLDYRKQTKNGNKRTNAKCSKL